jgi:copper chaperone CopZ
VFAALIVDLHCRRAAPNDGRRLFARSFAMRHWFVAIAVVIGLVGISAGSLQAEKITVKDIHLCCDQCEKAIGEALKKVDGISDVKCNQKTKTVTFTSKGDTTSGKALHALNEAGFFR